MRYVFLISAALLYAFPAQAADVAKPAGKHDSSAPIEITSDQLDVFQEENRAVFSGRVVAVQGDMRLKSEVMTVHYRDSGETQEGQAPQTGGSIEKIDVAGDVFLSTPEETASGDTGVYDVEKRELHLEKNVVLTREKNVLKGDHLIYNLDTGKSRLTGGAAATVTEKGGKPRVRALFVPDKTKEEKKP